MDTQTPTLSPPARIQLASPHAAQIRVRREAKRFNILACGRRWGKTQHLAQVAIETAVEGCPVGWFAPTYKFLEQAWDELADYLLPARSLVQSNKTERVIKFVGGGQIDFWTMERPHAGRGRAYKVALIDEAAIVRDLWDYWHKSIRPTLTDLRGGAWFASTPYGHNDFHRLWTRGQSAEPGWMSWQMPTVANPFISPEEIEQARTSMPADAFSQEYLAEFLADAANPFGVTAIRACIDLDLPQCKPSVWGIDLAKSTDWTVAVGLDDDGRVVAFQRWQSDWRNTRARLIGMIGDIPALVDSTGVGDPIVEDLQAACPFVEGFKFTSQSKQQLMEGLAVAIQRKVIALPPPSPDCPIVTELEVFQYVYKPGGRVFYSAPEGLHDDTVCALALAVQRLHSGERNRVSIEFIGADIHGYGKDQPWLDERNEAIWQ